MAIDQRLSEIREWITTTLRRNSDRGSLPYRGCDQVCMEMFSILEEAEQLQDQKLAFDIRMLILLRMMKIISYADTSSGMATDVIQTCFANIEELCQNADEIHHKYFFDTIIKGAKNKVFQGWGDDSYELLKSAVYFVCNKKQAQKITDTFPLLGTSYNGNPYPEQLLITLAMIERLDGTEAADQYMMEHIDVPEMRMHAVEKALESKHYLRVEALCREAIKGNIRGHYGRRSPWAYYLERLYTETAQQEKLLEMIRFILLERDTSYFQKLKDMYVAQNVWEEMREPLWQELSKVLAPHEFAALLAEEDEVQKLLDVVRQHPDLVFHYGKQLAVTFPVETYAMFEACIITEAQAATDRRKYRQVCRMIKDFAAAGAKGRALELVDRLAVMYPRRPAMLEELAAARNKLEKHKK